MEEQLTAETKRFLKKRNEIINIMLEMKISYETLDEYITATPNFWECRPIAEKILAKVGIHKTEQVIRLETSGYALGLK